MAGETILVVEDEKDLSKLLRYNLEQRGYRVLTAGDGETALVLFEKEKPDLLLLDVMLPKRDGYEVCRQIREKSATPILMLTAKRDEAHRVLGLELGADDYVTKPFSLQELLARIKTILRRVHPETSAPSGKMRFGALEVDFGRHVVAVKGKEIPVRSKEFEFLKVLIQAKGNVLTRDQLLEKVWGLDASVDIDTRTIDQHITRLRKHLGPESGRIVTVKNVGYRFEVL